MLPGTPWLEEQRVPVFLYVTVFLLIKNSRGKSYVPFMLLESSMFWLTYVFLCLIPLNQLLKVLYVFFTVVVRTWQVIYIIMDCIIQIIFFKSKFSSKIPMALMKYWCLLESTKISKKQTLLHIAIIAGSLSTAKSVCIITRVKKTVYMNSEHITLKYGPRL